MYACFSVYRADTWSKYLISEYLLCDIVEESFLCLLFCEKALRVDSHLVTRYKVFDLIDCEISIGELDFEVLFDLLFACFDICSSTDPSIPSCKESLYASFLGMCMHLLVKLLESLLLCEEVDHRRDIDYLQCALLFILYVRIS